MSHEIRFDDGAAYDRYMGRWSRLVGDTFLEWLAPKPGLRWLDVGCGNGAFTTMIAERCAPLSIDGIDPSEAQLAHARSLPVLRTASLRVGDAMALPFPDDTFDIAVMPLVIFFVRDPAKGVAEMTRVVRSGGVVTAYAWDMAGGAFPYQALQDEIRGMGVAVPTPPSPDASRPEALHGLWARAGLETIRSREVTVHRSFDDVDDYWTTILGAPSAGRILAAMTSDDIDTLKSRMRSRFATAADGRIVCSARANAISGCVP